MPKMHANLLSIIGLVHHLKYRKTGMTTKLAPYHVWNGRIIIPLGIVNAFLYVQQCPCAFIFSSLTPPSGFTFSLNGWRNVILAILLVAVAGVAAFFVLSHFRRNRKLRRRESSPVFGFSSGPDKSAGPGEPYADQDGDSVGLREYAPSPAQINLMDVSGGQNLGPEQKGRDFL